MKMRLPFQKSSSKAKQLKQLKQIEERPVSEVESVDTTTLSHEGEPNTTGKNEADQLDALTQQRWSPSRVQAVATRWKLTEEQHSQLKALGDQLLQEGVHHKSNDPEEVVRFLVEAKSPAKAAQMFHKFLEWRVNEMDTLIEDFPPHPLLTSHCPMTLLEGLDKEGDGIWLERPGATDLYGLYEVLGAPALLKYALYVRELSTQVQWRQDYEAKFHRAPRVIAVLDLQGLNRRHMRPALLPLIAQAITVIQDYYCGYIKKIIIIREPAVFKLLWSMIKGFFNQNMKDLMVFAGSDYQRVLADYIDNIHETLPPCLIEGGQGKVAQGMPQRLEGGPWTPEEAAPVEKKRKPLRDSSVSATEECSSSAFSSSCSEVEEEQEEEITTSTSPVRVQVRTSVLAYGSF